MHGFVLPPFIAQRRLRSATVKFPVAKLFTGPSLGSAGPGEVLPEYARARLAFSSLRRRGNFDLSQAWPRRRRRIVRAPLLATGDNRVPVSGWLCMDSAHRPIRRSSVRGDSERHAASAGISCMRSTVQAHHSTRGARGCRAAVGLAGGISGRGELRSVSSDLP